MKASKEDPLWIIGLGAATNIASAYLKEPAIADRIRSILAFAYSLARKMLEFQCVWRPPCGKIAV